MARGARPWPSPSALRISPTTRDTYARPRCRPSIFNAATPAAADDPTASPDPGVTATAEPTPSPTPWTVPPLLSPTTSPDPVTMPSGDYGGKTPSTPVIAVTCTHISVGIPDLARTGGKFGVGWGPASAGTPEVTVFAYPYNPAVELDFDPAHLPYNGTATRWRVVVYNDLGYAAFERSGTTTPCPAPPTAKPPAPTKLTACGATMNDVVPVPTPGIWYSHDDWNLYAHLASGWTWDPTLFWTNSPTWLVVGRSELNS